MSNERSTNPVPRTAPVEERGVLLDAAAVVIANAAYDGGKAGGKALIGKIGGIKRCPPPTGKQ